MKPYSLLERKITSSVLHFTLLAKFQMACDCFLQLLDSDWDQPIFWLVHTCNGRIWGTGCKGIVAINSDSSIALFRYSLYICKHTAFLQTCVTDEQWHNPSE